MRNMSKTKKQLCSILLFLVMLIVILPVSISAEEGEEQTDEQDTSGADSDTSTQTESGSSELTEIPQSNESESQARSGSVSGVLWLDQNSDGIFDDDEATIPGYPVYLYDKENLTEEIQKVTTDKHGKYEFSKLESGDYLVGVKAGENETSYILPVDEVKDDDGNKFLVDSESLAYSVVVNITEGSIVNDINCGMREAVEQTESDEGSGANNVIDNGNDASKEIEPEQSLDNTNSPSALEADANTGSINGTIWLDENDNGLRDVDETGIDNYPVYLYAADKLNDPVTKTVTNKNGLYTFAEIQSGEYIVGIKSGENDTNYLLPSDIINNGNKFLINTEDNTIAFTKIIMIESNTVAENIDGGIRKKYETSVALRNQSTFSAVSNAMFTNPPPPGPDISKLFHIVELDDVTSFYDEGYDNVVVITPDKENQFGGMWAEEKLNLNLPFNIEMYIHLGHEAGKDGNVADGMTFTLHNDKAGLKAIGGRGEGLGAYTGRMVGTEDKPDRSYINNSLSIEFDTFSNSGFYMEDPKNTESSAHCALIMPRENEIKENDHNNTFFFKPSQEWVKFVVEWKPMSNDNNLGGELNYTFAGVNKKYTINNVNAIFGGNEVFWGFTGATGGLTSLQAAAIARLPVQDLSSKQVSKESASGVAGTSVKIGDEITYEINYVNSTGKKADLIITDMLPKGLEYIEAKGSDDIEYNNKDRTVVWNGISNVEVGYSGIVTIKAKVTEDADEILLNEGKLEWSYDGGSLIEVVTAENPVIPRKTVIINYVDHEGEQIKTSTVERVNVNEYFTYTVPIDGYEFDKWELNNVEQGGDPETSFIVTDNTVINLIYSKMADFSFYKVDISDTSKILTGAEFELYLWKGAGDATNELVPKDLDGSGWTLIGTRESGNDGLVLFENLSSGIYQLVETKAPKGYQLPLGQWRFEVSKKGGIINLSCVGENKPPAIKENNMDDKIPYLIGNVMQYELPEMGGRGVILYWIFGIFLLLAGIVATIIHIHRNKST